MKKKSLTKFMASVITSGLLFISSSVFAYEKNIPDLFTIPPTLAHEKNNSNQFTIPPILAYEKNKYEKTRLEKLISEIRFELGFNYSSDDVENGVVVPHHSGYDTFAKVTFTDLFDGDNFLEAKVDRFTSNSGHGHRTTGITEFYLGLAEGFYVLAGPEWTSSSIEKFGLFNFGFLFEKGNTFLKLTHGFGVQDFSNGSISRIDGGANGLNIFGKLSSDSLVGFDRLHKAYGVEETVINFEAQQAFNYEVFDKFKLRTSVTINCPVAGKVKHHGCENSVEGGITYEF